MRRVIRHPAPAANLAGTSLLAAACQRPATSADAPGVPPREGPSGTLRPSPGKDLESWVGNPERWSIIDVVIVGKHTGPVKVGTSMVTSSSYSDFRLKAKGKLVASGPHPGIASWGRVAPSTVPSSPGQATTYRTHPT